MKMSMDEAIKRIEEHNYIHQEKEPQAIYISEAFDIAIDAMRKYQKIREILKEDTYYEEYGNNAERFIVSDINKVVNNNEVNEFIKREWE